jgi:dTDP-4-dehydrorhamnose reductase
VKTILRLASASPDGELRFVDDQRGCPTSAADLAAVIARLAVGRCPGTFHVTNQGPTTWFQMARDVLAFAGLDPSRVVPVTTAELGRPAPRPANSVLANIALASVGITQPPDHHEPLERLVKELTAP